MSDEADDAQGFEDVIARQIRHRLEMNRSHHMRPSNLLCDDCGEPIPQARRDIGGMTRCVDCQSDAERHLG